LGENDEIVRLQEQVKTLFTGQRTLSENLDKHEKDYKLSFAEVFKRMDEMQKSFQNRLPPWAVAIISLLMGACGWFAKG